MILTEPNPSPHTRGSNQRLNQIFSLNEQQRRRRLDFLSFVALLELSASLVVVVFEREA